ncbi:MAG: phosphate ABC transporter substrate-binding protein [Gammaproteobacteria bacterium]|nr:phosphate ABC transporter substrate-binding protein [Gammaproteobacteria bacterium]
MLITLSATTLSFSQLANAEVVVVVNPDNPVALTAKDIKRIFLGKMKSFPGSGNTIQAVNHSSKSAVRKRFDKKALGKSPKQIKAYWSRLMFSGKGNPLKEVENDAKIIELVAENPSVIGYIDSSSKTGNVKVVGTF